MKRAAIILVAVTVLVIGTLIVAPRFIPADIARDRISEQITQWIGRSVTFSGEPEITLFPRPAIRLHEVEIADQDGSEVFITAEELTGTFRFLPLLWGAVEVNAFDLVRPTIRLRVDGDGQSNWAFDGTVGERISEAFREPGDAAADRRQVSEVVLGRFQIVDGTITFDQPGTEQAVLSQVELDVHWPSTETAATANGSLMWRGERIDIAATLSEPLELIAGRESSSRFTIAGQPIRIAFDGTVSRSELDFAFDGKASMTTGSLRRVIDWIGAPMTAGTTLAGAGFSGDASWVWPVLSFSNAEMRLDGNVAGGAVSIDFGGERTHIIGTLAFEELDLSPYADAFRTDVDAEGAWREAPIDLPALADVDWDIRVSADRLILGNTRVDGFAASAIVNHGAIDLRLAEAGFYGGHIQASLTGMLTGPSLSAEVQLTLVEINMLPALDDLVGVASLAGRASVTMTARSQGHSWGELVQALTGTAQATAMNGTFRGVDLSAAAETPTIGAALAAEGMTSFDSLTAAFTFYGGQLIADRVDANGPGFDLAFIGWGSLAAPTIGGVGIAWLYGPTDGEIRELPFNVTGNWLDPVFQDDASATALIGPRRAE